jgi:predicted  nucleic acid-binding Zn-ribbon protein
MKLDRSIHELLGRLEQARSQRQRLDERVEHLERQLLEALSDDFEEVSTYFVDRSGWLN